LAWTIEYAESACRQLRILDFIDKRTAPNDDPHRLGKALKGPLGELWLYRVGNFRIVCDLQDEVLTVLALQIGNRREVNRR
jgi:mRNA interferase RelE/StbE